MHGRGRREAGSPSTAGRSSVVDNFCLCRETGMQRLRRAGCPTVLMCLRLVGRPSGGGL